MAVGYVNGYITHGSYFTYKGRRYGCGTVVKFTDDFYKRQNDYSDRPWFTFGEYRKRFIKVFSSIKYENGKETWSFGNENFFPMIDRKYTDVAPDRDIEKIVTPVWYYEPKELAKMRLREGIWIWYVWPQTLIYALCLLISPLFQQWYLIWTIGLYAYLRLCYIKLSEGGLNRGW